MVYLESTACLMYPADRSMTMTDLHREKEESECGFKLAWKSNSQEFTSPQQKIFSCEQCLSKLCDRKKSSILGEWK